MLEPITELAMSGATAVVAAMATSAWGGTREAVVRLFRRQEGQTETSIEEQLDSTAARVAGAPDAVVARERIIPLWQGELEDLLRRHPEAAEELRGLIARARAGLPRPEQAPVQNITAHGAGHAYGALNGNVVVHHHPPAAPPPDEGPGS
ncbi:hypothetical protein [Streptomyces sp. NPDC051079]|uniref:hypothetical protein n=1 Tax=Streptomyces sp. NPDC051079 TaxID=3155043 RepID=UPI0034501A99